MNQTDHQAFLEALQAKRRVTLGFYSKEDASVLTRSCAPMDFGPSRRAKNKDDRYHFWDYDSDTGRHTLSLVPDQVQSIQASDEEFSPAEFVTWSVAQSPWFVQRDWGEYS